MRASRDVLIRVEGRAGRITLNRPQALNALTHAMALAIEEALVVWRGDAAVALIVIEAAGEKAFCAGGDIQDLYRTGRAGDYGYGRRFWADEYRLNALIAGYPKPYVALMDGITMGGGVGISAHGSHRVATERTVLAMPECGIGLIPDVGGSFILGRAPGRLGLYLGLTGTRLKADGAIHTGFADRFVPSARIGDLVAALVETGDAGAVETFAEAPEEGNLRRIKPEVDSIFDAGDPEGILLRLERGEGGWQAEAAAAIRRASPLSVQCAFRAIEAAGAMTSVREALATEYRFAARCMEHGDFIEGVRAAIIDKDRAPQWRHESLAEAAADADRMMAPLEDDALDLEAQAENGRTAP